MKSRLLKKVVSTIYDAATKGDFKSAHSRLQKMHPMQQRKVLNVFNEQAFKRLGAENGATVVANFAGYRGLQQGLKAVGGTQGMAEQISRSMNEYISETLGEASKGVLKEWPQTSLGWLKLGLKEEWIAVKNFVKTPASKFRNYVKNKFKLSKSTNSTNTTVQAQSAKKSPIISKNIPSEYKSIFANLEGRTGQEFVDTAYGNMVSHMKLNGIAPKKITINDNDGIISVTGGYDYINNTIGYSKGFLEKLTPQQQMNLISHELKHCEQFSNILRTENIGVKEYARVISENSLKRALDKSSFEFMLKNRYEQALKQGKGDEFIKKTIDSWTEKLIPEIETNFSEVLKLPKIKANSPSGIKAVQDLKAMKNYEGLDAFGFGSENYRNNPLEVEAYAFGDNIEKLFKDFISLR